jgi:hypothetical protein
VCLTGNVVSEMDAYARPQDFGTTPEVLRLLASKGVQSAGGNVVFPNFDPDHDGDMCDTGALGYADYKAGVCPVWGGIGSTCCCAGDWTRH